MSENFSFSFQINDFFLGQKDSFSFELVRTFLSRAPFWLLAVHLSSDLRYATPRPAQKLKTHKLAIFSSKQHFLIDLWKQSSQKRPIFVPFCQILSASIKRELQLRRRRGGAESGLFGQFEAKYFASFSIGQLWITHWMGKILFASFEGFI